MNLLTSYGVTSEILKKAESLSQGDVARVIAQYNNLYRIIDKEGSRLAKVSGKFRHQIREISDFPAVGDYVIVSGSKAEEAQAVIHHRIERKTELIRRAAEKKEQNQVLAANVDVVFLCMAANSDYNLRRLERYAAMAWESGAQPVVVLTKVDLCENKEEKILEIATITAGMEQVQTSMYDLSTVNALRAYIIEGKTACFLGSSGVGKTTLINTLLGKNALQTGLIRKDGKGRHTTTRRDMLLLPEGGILIDTPGMREFGLNQASLETVFEKIETLSTQCRFRNCTHQSEPGCAVKEAIKSGELDEERLQSYEKLKKETGYEGLSAKAREKKKMDVMFSQWGGMKKAKKAMKKPK